MTSMKHDVVRIIAALREAQARCACGLERRAASLVVENCYGVHLGPGITGGDVLSILMQCGYIVDAGEVIRVVDDPHQCKSARNSAPLLRRSRLPEHSARGSRASICVRA